MDASILAPKLNVPSPQSDLASRPRLVEQLDAGLRLGRRLTLVAASAGSGKTTLLAEWAAIGKLRFCWLSLEEDDNDAARFWTYVVAALQTVRPQLGQSVLSMLQGPQLPPIRSVFTSLLNEVAALPAALVLVLDDYHFILAAARARELGLLSPAPEQ